MTARGISQAGGTRGLVRPARFTWQAGNEGEADGEVGFFALEDAAVLGCAAEARPQRHDWRYEVLLINRFRRPFCYSYLFIVTISFSYHLAKNGEYCRFVSGCAGVAGKNRERAFVAPVRGLARKAQSDLFHPGIWQNGALIRRFVAVLAGGVDGHWELMSELESQGLDIWPSTWPYCQWPHV